MDEGWVKLPLDLRGVIAYWMKRAKGCTIDVCWRAPWLDESAEKQVRFEPIELRGMKTVHRLRLLRLLGVDGSPAGPWSARAAGAAARAGRIGLSLSLVDSWIRGEAVPLAIASRARLLLKSEERRLKTVQNSQRSLMRDILHLEDLPASLVLPAIRLHRSANPSFPIKVKSGGHHLAPGNWLWKFPAGTHSPSSVRRISDIGIQTA